MLWTFLLEGCGAIAIWLMTSESITPYSALFHSISAFCNAGFSQNRDSLVALKSNLGLNLIIIFLIIAGGLGFSVLVELQFWFVSKFRPGRSAKHGKLNWYAGLVIRTTLFLVVAGWGIIYLAEFVGYNRENIWAESLLTALFQSVTCRTAGFNTLDIGAMTNVSLLVMTVLMFIGGAPGSCAGGVDPDGSS